MNVVVLAAEVAGADIIHAVVVCCVLQQPLMLLVMQVL